MATKSKSDDSITKLGDTMKTDIFMLAFPEIFASTVKQIQEMNPEILFESNFEQVYAMCKLGEVNKICIRMDVNNISDAKFSVARGQVAAEKIHQFNPNIPILIWAGRSYINEDKTLPDIFKVEGVPIELKNKNELYLHFNEEFYEITQKFFEGTLNQDDLVEYQYECLGNFF